MNASSAALIGTYDERLVVLSALIAVITSYAALVLAERGTAARRRRRLLWISWGGIALGIGMWSMHFIGMLAFKLPVPVWYHWPTAILSLVVAIFASALLLYVASLSRATRARTIAAGFAIGAAVVAVHYLLVASMRLAADRHYAPLLVVASVALAMMFSFTAVELARGLRGRRARGAKRPAILMGAAMCAMHYTGLRAATLVPTSAPLDLSHAIALSPLAIVDVGLVSLMVLVFAVMTSTLDRLDEQRTMLNELFEQTPQAVAIVDTGDRVVRVNREFAQLFGYRPHTVTGRYIRELVGPDAQPRERRDGSGAGDETEVVCRRNDGSLVHVAMSRVPLDIPGSRIAAYVMYRDITERKRAEEAERAVEQRFRAVFLNAATGMAITNTDGRYLSVNQALCRITGYTEEELLARTWMSITHPEDLERDMALNRRMYAGELRTFVVEKRYIAKDGRTVWARNSLALLERRRDLPATAISVIEDVTSRKQAGAALQRSFEELRALADRLQNVREEERARVAREIHDELGQALTSIKIDLAALIRGLPAGREEAQTRARSVLQLVDETIQSVRRIATELRPGILDDLGLVAAVEWATEEFQARNHVICHVVVPPEDIPMSPERATALFRILQETLTNIARHANATEVHVRLGTDNGNLFLEVRDNGTGIEDTELATSRSLGILGMRERAVLLGGELSILSAPGHGTTVTVRIPGAGSQTVGAAQ